MNILEIAELQTLYLYLRWCFLLKISLVFFHAG
jgi:hypothetical protein